ncbi:MAG: Sterol 3-beta-glucosyltransferase [Geoglossum umbratile]|nr:MAG: Sterol 3-beta-glucosyltransferase [Geoglossum umbratile]
MGQGSSDSYVHSLDREPGSPGAIHTVDDGTQASASQILSRSDVFRSPTMQRLQQADSDSGLDSDGQRVRVFPNENKCFASDTENMRVHPPARSQAQRNSNEASCGQAGDGASESDNETDTNRGGVKGSSSPTLQEIMKAGVYPLQRAAGLAGYLKNSSKRMSSLLATESMGYLEKVTGMWAGGRRHYDKPAGLMPDDELEDEDEDDVREHGNRFRAHFALPEMERLQATYFGFLHRVIPLYGKIYISNKSFCFRSLLPGTRTKLILPLKDVENVDKEGGFRFGYSGLVIVIRGHEELFFEFSQPDVRDDCVVTLLRSLEQPVFLKTSGLLTQEEREEAEAARAEMLLEALQDDENSHDLGLPKSENDIDNSSEAPPIIFDDPRASILNFKPPEPLRITCLTIGSRGDVQPYIALCKGLLAEGHRPKIATHAEFRPWIEKHGIEFARVEGDPAELMRICIENGMFTYSFIREASLKFRGWLDELLSSAWAACRDSDVLIESPSAMAGIHIAEALGIPYFRAFTMPWTRTRAYPHAFAVPEHKMGGAYNYFTYVMFDNVFWKAIAGQINRWRKHELGLSRTNLHKLQPNKAPFLYNFSPSVVPPPLDYSDWIRVTGYWFLNEADGWEPPKELTDFIRKAREDRKKVVYVGFGSIVVSDPAALTKTIIDSVLTADVRCILSKGWSDRLSNKDASTPEVPLPPEILQIKSAPHDWLFGQIDAAAHHGGAGTTGASLRAGLPTIIKPFFGDQFFFGSRIEDLGVGTCIKKLNVDAFSRALWRTTNDERMIVKAKVLGEQIRKEDGVEAAVKSIYRDLDYAKSLIKKRGVDIDDAPDDSEESWTFIGDESDPDLQRRIAEWEPMTYMGQSEYVWEK